MEQPERIGDYDVLSTIGAGGMGVVYKARHQTLGRIAAVKVLKGERRYSAEHVERFKREAAACARLKHPNIVNLLDYGEDRGTVYLAMEYIEGQTLADLIESKGCLPFDALLRIGREICDALCYLHGEGLLHRDIKPSNVMIGPAGAVTLMDFGLVKFAASQEALTREGKAIGTPRYMSPEMLRADMVDARSDIFQVGLLLYEAATDCRPYAGKDVYAIAAAILSTEPTPPSSLRRELPPSFDTLLANCLARRPADRYQTAQCLLDDLTRCQRNEPIDATCSPQGNTTNDECLPSASRSGLDDTYRFDLSSLSNSVASIRSHLTPFQLAATFAMVLGCLFFVSYTSRPNALVRAENVEVWPDIGGATVTWNSNAPTPSEVRYWPKDGRAPDDERRATRATETTTHSLYIPDLQYDRAYSFVIEYADGRHSLVQTIPPLRHRHLAVVNRNIRQTSLTSLDLSFTSNIACRSQLTYRHEGQLEKRPLSSKPCREHGIVLDGLELVEALEDVAIILESEAATERVVIGAVGGLPAAIARTKRYKTQFDLPDILTRIEKLFPFELNPTERARARQAVKALLDDLPSWRSLQGERSLYRSIFASPVAAVRASHPILYDCIRFFEHVDAQLDQRQAGFDLNIASFYAPYVTLSHYRTRRPGSDLTLFSLKERESTFVPAEQHHQSSSAAGIFTIYRSHEQFTPQPEYVINRDLSDFLGNCGERPLLVARVRNFEPAYYLRVSINDLHHIDLRNRADTVPPLRYLFDRANRDVEDEAYQLSMNYIAAQFPRSLLRPGTNRFRVVLHVIPTFKTINMLQVRELCLYGH